MEISTHRLIRAVLLLAVLLMCSSSGGAFCEETEPEKAARTPILFFYSADCSDCHAMKRMIDAVLSEDPSLPIREICIEDDPETWSIACKNADIPIWGVPRIFVGDLIFAGWSDKDGPLLYIPSYYGYMGYKNQLLSAMEDYLGMPIPEIKETETDEQPSGGDCIGGC